MSGTKPGSRSGWGWLVLIGLPPVIVVIGLAFFITRQVQEGKMSPKWKPRPGRTNQVEAGVGTNSVVTSPGVPR